MTHIDLATATAFIAANKGNDITVTVSDIIRNGRVVGIGGTFNGTAVSVNSKGVNIKMGDKVRSFGLARVTALDLFTPTVADIADADGLTTADVAALVGMTPKALRVITRSLGLGVGRGKRYTFDAANIAVIRAALANTSA